jgi:hypothetical protein
VQPRVFGKWVVRRGRPGPSVTEPRARSKSHSLRKQVGRSTTTFRSGKRARVDCLASTVNDAFGSGRRRDLRNPASSCAVSRSKRLSEDRKMHPTRCALGLADLVEPTLGTERGPPGAGRSPCARYSTYSFALMQPMASSASQGASCCERGGCFCQRSRERSWKSICGSTADGRNSWPERRPRKNPATIRSLPSTVPPVGVCDSSLANHRKTKRAESFSRIARDEWLP